MLAFHNDPAIKQMYLDRVRQHREADEIVQGYGYWSDGKGCAVGCTLHVDDSPHQHYESTLGIPERIAHLEDAIFEELPVEKAREWPERFLASIKPGADLSLVWHRFAAWLLRESELLAITDANRDEIASVLSLHVRGAAGDQPTEQEWGAAWSAACSAASSAAWSAACSAACSAASGAASSAAWSAACSAASGAASSAARSAAWSAASSARSAACSAARSAAWSAASSARSAAWSDSSVASSAAYEAMADKLVQLLSECQPCAA